MVAANTTAAKGDIRWAYLPAFICLNTRPTLNVSPARLAFVLRDTFPFPPDITFFPAPLFFDGLGLRRCGIIDIAIICDV